VWLIVRAVSPRAAPVAVVPPAPPAAIAQA
jgi:hypothetical protein